MPLVKSVAIKKGGILGTQTYYKRGKNIQYGGSLKSILTSAWAGVKKYAVPIIKGVINSPKTQEALTGVVNKGVNALSDKLKLSDQSKAILSGLASKGTEKLSSAGKSKLNQLLGEGLRGKGLKYL